MNIKVCGITQLKQLQELDEMGIDFVGLNFYKESPRYVAGKIAGEDVRDGDFDIRKVGIFVNESVNSVLKTAEDYGLDIVQLHGDEAPEYCKRLSEQVEVMKVFRLDKERKSINDLIRHYDDVCDYYMFDSGNHSPAPGGNREVAFGGTGEKFDWDLLTGSSIEKPFFLAGGIGLPDVVKVKTFDHPDLFAVDINSKFEISPGEKDLDLVKMFAQVLRN
jgi:phosphoribosylanthranilate isomerase